MEPQESKQLKSADEDFADTVFSPKAMIYEPSSVILLKGVPYDASEADILNIVKSYGIILDLYLVRHKGYAFVQFKDYEAAVECYKVFSIHKPALKKNSLHIFYTGKSTITKPNTLLSPPSRYLLLVFQKYFVPINYNSIYQMLAPYGKCMKVVIFQTKFLQAFVEMEDIGQAIIAKESLDNSDVNGQMQLNVLYIEQKDFYVQQQQSQFPGLTPTPDILPPSMSQPGSLTSLDIYSPMNDSMQFNQLMPVPYSMPQITPYHGSAKNRNPYNQHTQYNYWPQPQMFYPFGVGFLSAGNTPTLNNEDTVTFKKFKEKASSMQNIENNQNENFDKTMSMFLQTKGQKEGSIVLVKGLPPNITPIMLFRLFGLYGNVQKVKIFFKNPESGLVEFEDPSQALLAKMHLNNCPLFRSNIFVTISKQGVVINTSNIKKGEENDLVADYTESKDHRYKILGSKNYKNITAPSKVLHLSNLCEDKDENFYRELFKNHAHIQKIHFLKGDSKMMLMEMKSIADAVAILVHFHNYDIDGKFLKVSFSKYQKIKD